MTLSVIVAASENDVIGREGGLPWRLPDDLARFKRLTTGHPIVMGRKTFESIGRPLPGRTSVVVSRQADYDPGCEGVLAAGSLDEALEIAEQQPGGDEVFVIGGAQIYALAIPLADRLYLTRVHAHVEGDVCLPEFAESHWRVVEESHHGADERNEYAHTFWVLERSNDAA